MAAPNDPEDQSSDDLVTALVAAYLGGTAALLAVYSRIIRESLAAGSTIDFARILRRSRRAAQAEVEALEGHTNAMLPRIFERLQIEAAVRAHREHQRESGITPMRAARNTEPIFITHAEFSAQVIRDDLDGRLTEVRVNALRSADDLYRDIVGGAAEQQVRGLATPQEAIGQAFGEFVEKGITAYYTRDGRRLPIESYAEMAIRTAALRAYNVSYESRLQAIGVDYFRVPNDGHPCPLCWPWQHRVLTAGVPDEIASATIEQARAAGLFHPQCKHVLMPYFPGRSTEPPKPTEWTEQQAAAYATTQRLRALERRVRAQKTARDLSVTPEARQAAVRRVRATEALIRAHVERHDLVRRRHRETAKTTG